MDDTSDRRLLEQTVRAHHAAGDLRAATLALLQLYRDPIYRFLRARLGDEAAAQDVFSEFTVDVWRGIGNFRWSCPARVWAYTLARHAMLRWLRKQRQQQRRERPLSRAPGWLEVAQPMRTATATSLRSAAQRRLEELCRQLSDEDQTLLGLRVSRQLGWNEIAQVMLGETDPTPSRIAVESARLRKRFQLIKRRLRKQLEEDRAPARSSSHAAVE